MSEPKKAVLYGAEAPSEEQKARFLRFLSETYGENVSLSFEKTEKKDGFVLKVGNEVYDWSAEGRRRQLETALRRVSAKPKELIPLLRETVHRWVPEVFAETVGTVQTVGDGIATVTGLTGVFYGEILLFDGGVRGMAQNLSEKEVGCILFDDGDSICEGSTVTRTGRVAGIAVGDGMIGRVVGPLGNPLDEGGEILTDAYRPIEHPAPAIIDRQSVNRPLQTGILTVDSMFPIGRGQRELIIGDRQTGKTALAIDTILNQKGKDVLCIYVAIGQKASSVAQLTESLRQRGAMDYTIVVSATASQSAPMQYIAPYAGCAIGEYFMDKGRDVLIVYDDLSKHAVAYRSMSLLLDRSPGREAYPGDVFYLHSRLLERSAQLSPAKGGGSMTALPIVETQAGDVSAYIPTNIISITDGQIFLETDLFFAGQRPAVNVGLSVSRVGGDAQTKAMKKATGTLRLDLAQYREMKVFTQFASDLDDATKKQLSYGQGLMAMLCQGRFQPYTVHEMVILLVAALSHTLENIPAASMKKTCADLLCYFRENDPTLCERLESTGELTDTDREEIVAQTKAFLG